MTYSPEVLYPLSHPDILDSPQPELMGLPNTDLVIYDPDEADNWLAKHDQSVVGSENVAIEKPMEIDLSDSESHSKAKKSKPIYRKARETEVVDGPLCATQDPELFFLDRPNAQQTKEALSVCARCVIRATCLEGAIARGEEFGIWGNVSRQELDQLIRKRKRAEEKKAREMRARTEKSQ